MKLNKKGFTLVELLAIIVILAIIALITIPIITNIIKDVQKNADARSVEAYAKALESKYYMTMLSTQNFNLSIKNVKVDNADYSGATVYCYERTENHNSTDSNKENKVELTNCYVEGRYKDYTFNYISGQAKAVDGIDDTKAQQAETNSKKVDCTDAAGVSLNGVITGCTASGSH